MLTSASYLLAARMAYENENYMIEIYVVACFASITMSFEGRASKLETGLMGLGSCS